MRVDRTLRGSKPAGTLSALPAWECELIRNTRLWMDSSDGRRKVWDRYASSMGAERATQSLNAFERLLVTIEIHMSHQMVRHSVGCRCIGSDEAVFLHLVRTASAWDLNEASQIAALIVKPAHAEPLAHLAASVGETLRTLHITNRNRTTYAGAPNHFLH